MAHRVLPIGTVEPTTTDNRTVSQTRWLSDVGAWSGDNVGSPMHAVTNVYRSRELLWNLTLRELRTKYRRSFLGWAWSMLNPLSQILIYGFVFGTLFQATAPVGSPSGLDSFALYLLCGLLPWNFFGLITSLGLSSISVNSGLVRRVAFPREVLVFSNVLHACVQFSIEMVLLLIVMLIAGSPFLPWLPLIVITSILLAVFATGLAMALSVLAVYFRDVSYLWAILIQVWFFATPIVYPPSLLEAQAPSWVNNILKLNPMNAFIEVYRRLLYDAGAPGWKTMLGLVVISLASLTLGWMIFHRMSRRLPEEV
jgi:lipopolysaccharide transport system permease protein